MILKTFASPIKQFSLIASTSNIGGQRRMVFGTLRSGVGSEGVLVLGTGDMYAIYGIPIYWRYICKRVIALLVTQKSKKKRRGGFKKIQRRSREDGSRRSGVVC